MNSHWSAHKPTQSKTAALPHRTICMVTIILATGLLFGPPSAHGKSGGSKSDGALESTTAPTGKASKKKGTSKVTYQRSASEESPAQRDRRMFRECKGLHNAGACKGYTR